MFPTHSPTKTRTRSPLRRLATAAATTLLAAGGLTGLGAITASPAHASTTNMLRPSSYAPTADGQCSDLEINGQPEAAYPIRCSAPAFPNLWNLSLTSQTQTTDITLVNTSNSTLHLAPRDAPGYIEESIPNPYLPVGHSETISWTQTVSSTTQTTVVNGQRVIYLAAGIDIVNFGTAPNAGVGWSGFYPAVDTAAPAPTYSLTASASTTSLPTGSGSTITVENTGSADEHLTLCSAGRPIAAGIHAPGSSLTHTVVESTPGSATFTAYAGDSFACTGSSKSVTIDWTGNAPTPTPTPTSGLSPLAVAGHPEEPVGQPDMLYVGDTQQSGSAAEWLTACINGRAVASGLHVPGGVLSHPVAVSTAGGTVTVDAYSGSTPAICAGAEQTFTVTGEPAGPALAVPNLHAFAAATSAQVGTSVPIYVTDTASGPTWVTLCEAGRPVASAWKHPGQGMPHDVVSSTTGNVSYVAMQGRASCTGGEEANISIDWTAGS